MNLDIHFPEIETYSILRQKKSCKGLIQFHTGSVSDLVQELKSRPGKGIIVDGGAFVIARLLEKELIDQLTNSWFPIYPGRKSNFFQTLYLQKNSTIFYTSSFPSGVVQARYSVEKV